MALGDLGAISVAGCGIRDTAVPRRSRNCGASCFLPPPSLEHHVNLPSSLPICTIWLNVAVAVAVSVALVVLYVTSLLYSTRLCARAAHNRAIHPRKQALHSPALGENVQPLPIFLVFIGCAASQPCLACFVRDITSNPCARRQESLS